MRYAMVLAVLGLAACGGESSDGDGCWAGSEGRTDMPYLQIATGGSSWRSDVCLADRRDGLQYCISETEVHGDGARALIDRNRDGCFGEVVLIVSPQNADDLPPSGGYVAVATCGPCEFDVRESTTYRPEN